jgi:hypothetical protein
MFKYIRQLLKPPVFEEDEEKTRIASMANMILLATMLMITFASVVILVVLRVYLIMGVIYVSMTTPLIVAMVLLRRGHVREASWLATIALWVVLVGMGFLIGGVANSVMRRLFLVIIIAALLLGGRAACILPC